MLSRLASLQSLTLMGCSMSALPPALSALTNLRVLYLGEHVSVSFGASCGGLWGRAQMEAKL